MPSQINRDTLQQAGYQEGDVLVLGAWLGEDSTISTSSSSFGSVNSFGRIIIQEDGLRPSGVQLKAAMSVQLDTGGNQITGRYRNEDAGQTLVSITDSSSSGFVKHWSGWSDYNPSNPSTPEIIRYQHANGDNSTTVQSATPTLYLGIEI